MKLDVLVENSDIVLLDANVFCSGGKHIDRNSFWKKVEHYYSLKKALGYWKEFLLSGKDDSKIHLTQEVFGELSNGNHDTYFKAKKSGEERIADLRKDIGESRELRNSLMKYFVESGKIIGKEYPITFSNSRQNLRFRDFVNSDLIKKNKKVLSFQDFDLYLNGAFLSTNKNNKKVALISNDEGISLLWLSAIKNYDDRSLEKNLSHYWYNGFDSFSKSELR